MKAQIASSEFWFEINKRFGTTGGVYKLFSSSAESGEAVSIPRLLGEDREGILYIGMAASFLDRVIELKKSIAPGYASRAHECGARFKDHPFISQHFPYEKLFVTLIAADDPKLAEREALQAYLEQFGELPPLNRAG